MRSGWLVALPLLASGCSFPAFGQAVVKQSAGCPVEEPDVFGCTITVTGNLAKSRSEATESIASVQPNTGRLENDLLSVPGLQQFRRSDARSANPTSQGVTMRGLGGNASSRALLILDGVPQADPFGGWISWPGYDASNLASIRVRKGGGVVSAGPGDLAGIIELDSLQNQDLIALQAHYGSRHSVDAKASIMRQLGQGTMSVSGSYARGDGFIPITKSQRGSVDRGAPYEQVGLAVRMVAPLSDNTELQANLRAFTDKRDRGFNFSDNQNSGVDASLRLVNRNSDGWQWSALGYVQVRDFANRFGAVAAGRNSVSLTLDQFSVPSTGLGARFEVRPPIGDNAELRIGGDWRRTVGETKENFFFTGTVPGRNRNAGGRNETIGGFVEGSFVPVDTLTLTLGGRVDRWTIAGGFRKEINIGGSVRSNDVFASRSCWEGTGRVGFAWDGGSDLKLHGAAYHGWRLPTLNELYRPFRVGVDATAANELLSPERLKGAEIGFDFTPGDMTLSATAFINRLDSAIANVSVGRGPGIFAGVGFVAAGGIYRRRENLDAIRSKGVEIDAAYRIGDFTLRAGYAYVDAKVVAGGAAVALNSLRPAQVPKHFGDIGVTFDNRSIRAGASIRYVGSQFEDDANSRRLQGALTVDTNLSIPVGHIFRLELRGENLFDAQVQAAIGSDGVIERAGPRTILVGVALNF